MNRVQTVIFFVVLFVIVALIYVYLYHKKKKKTQAIVVAGILSVLVLLSIISVLPFRHRAIIVEANEYSMSIQNKGVNYYAVCSDGTEYKIKAMNTKMSSDYYSYRNDNKYANEKVEITYLYNYKIWGIIPAYSISHETDIYFDNDVFNEIYGCNLEYNQDNQ